MACSRFLWTAPLVIMIACPLTTFASAEESLEQRRRRLEAMPDSEKHTLLERKRQFDQLLDKEKEHLRDFHQQLENHEQKERLHALLRRYDEWLKSLMPGQRAQLLELPADQRIARIKEILRDQETQRFRMMVGGRLAEKDLQALREWLDDFIRHNEDQILAALPRDQLTRFLDDYDPDKHRRALPFLIIRHPSPDMPRPTPEDEARLQSLVSREARELLDSLDDDQERSRVLQTWIRAAWFSRMRPPIDRKDLDAFAAQQLDPQQREWLENLPRERMYHELRRIYSQDQFRQMTGDKGPRPPWSGGGPPPGSRPRGDSRSRGRSDSPGPWQNEPPEDRDREMKSRSGPPSAGGPRDGFRSRGRSDGPSPR
jgi:hypothetical protein